VWNGLGGFTSKYDFLFEATWWCLSPTSSRWQQNTGSSQNKYKPIGNLVKAEGDWWTIDAAYVVNNHLTLAAGYGHFGKRVESPRPMASGALPQNMSSNYHQPRPYRFTERETDYDNVF